MNTAKKTLLAAVGLFCLCLALVGAAKSLFAPTSFGPFFQVEASADSPENVILFLDASSCAVNQNTPQIAGAVIFNGVRIFYAEPQKNTQTVLNRIPQKAEDNFREKSLITLFAEAGYETFFVNADAAEKTSKEALTQTKGPSVQLLREILSRPRRKFAVIEPFKRETLADIIAVLEQSPKPSLLLSAGIKGCQKSDCPTEFLGYIAFYANNAYKSLPGNKEKLNNISSFAGAPLDLRYIFDTSASLAGLHYATADVLKDLTRLNSKALSGKSASFCKI